MHCISAVVGIVKSNDVFSVQFTFFFIAVLDITPRKHDVKYFSSLAVR